MNAQTKLIALIGHPIGHTKSPELFDHFVDEFETNTVYVPFDVEPGNLVTAINGLKAMGFHGANITAPYKTLVFKHARKLGIKLTEVAKKCQSVNCLYYEDGVLWGTTTDFIAFRDLFNNVVDSAVVSSVLVIGSGSMAKVVTQAVWNSMLFGCVDFVCRDTEKCSAEIMPMYNKYVREFKKNVGSLRLKSSHHVQPSFFQISARNDIMLNIVHQYDVIVNCTPVGMYPETSYSPLTETAALTLHSKQTVIDLIYNPPETKLLLQATEHGCNAINGKMMLVDQFVESFRLWFPRNTSGCTKDELVKFALKGW